MMIFKTDNMMAMMDSSFLHYEKHVGYAHRIKICNLL